MSTDRGQSLWTIAIVTTWVLAGRSPTPDMSNISRSQVPKAYLTKLSVPRLEFHQPFRHKRPVIFASQKPPPRNRDPLPNGPGNQKPGTRSVNQCNSSRCIGSGSDCRMNPHWACCRHTPRLHGRCQVRHRLGHSWQRFSPAAWKVQYTQACCIGSHRPR